MHSHTLLSPEDAAAIGGSRYGAERRLEEIEEEMLQDVNRNDSEVSVHTL